MTTQRRVARAVLQLTELRGYPPTVREIAEHAGLSSTSIAAYWLKRLRQRRLVFWQENHARTLRLTTPGEAYATEDEDERAAG